MTDLMMKALEGIRAVGPAEELLALAKSGRGGIAVKANTHVHLPPNFSALRDGAQAVELAAQEGLNCLGASNYYNFAAYGPFAAAAAERGLFPLFGVEIIAFLGDLARAGVRINDPGNPGKMYLCGKGIFRFERLTPEAARILGRIRGGDAKRMARMVALMDGVFERAGVPTGLDDVAAVSMLAERCGVGRETVTLQERHVALLFQEALFARVGEGERTAALAAILGVPAKAEWDAAKVQNELRSHLMKAGKPAYVEEEFVSFDDAYRLVLELGGIPCYPTLADGAGTMCPFETPVEKLIDEIRARDIHCAEFIPNRNDAAVLEKYVLAMRAAGLVVTAGTEHNTPELLRMTPGVKGGGAVPERVARVFEEGACVAAAHQFLTASGECGFVDGKGRLNEAFGGREQLIATMAALGAVVIGRYRGGKGR